MITSRGQGCCGRRKISYLRSHISFLKVEQRRNREKRSTHRKQSSPRQFKSIFWGTWLVQWIEHAPLALGVMSSIPHWDGVYLKKFFFQLHAKFSWRDCIFFNFILYFIYIYIFSCLTHSYQFWKCLFFFF